MFEGEAITIGGTEYVIPPLSFKQLKALKDDIKLLDDASIDLFLKTAVMSKVVHAALSRNYPEMTIQEVEEMMDMGNMIKVIPAVMGTSGFLKGLTEGMGKVGLSST